jgi:hypothetical protein
MTRLATRLASLSILLVGAFAIGCGSSGKTYPDATVTPDTGAAGTTVTPDAGSDAPIPPPTPAASSKLIIKGSVELIGTGTDSCTNQIPPSGNGDRWCAFARASAILGASELWVVNVTKAAAGVTINCDSSAPDPNCLRLSGGLFSDPNNGFQIHGFTGDTLTYSEDPGFNDFAWRPGWTAPRQLTTNNGLGCNGHPTSTAVLCVENDNGDGTTTPRTVEIHAGLLDAQTGDDPPLVDTLLIAAPNDKLSQQWGFQITTDGRAVAWSTRATATGTEDLHWQKIGDMASKLDVATDVSRWAVSADSTKWFWLKSFNYDTTSAPSGTLQSAPYPAGTTPLTIAMNAADFREAGPKGLAFRTSVKTLLGTLLVAPDRDAPAALTMIDTGVRALIDVSPDGKSISYTKNLSTSAPLFDAYVGTTAGTMPCTLTSQVNAFEPPLFLAGGTLVTWGRYNMLTQILEGLTTTLPGCVTSRFANDLLPGGAIHAADQGLVYLDTFNPDPSIFEATLRDAKVTDGKFPASGTIIQDRAGLQFAVLVPALPAVVYLITANGTTDGLYINSTLPFSVTTFPTADGGTDTTAPADTGGGGGGDVGASEAGGTTDAGSADTGGAETQPNG